MPNRIRSVDLGGGWGKAGPKSKSITQKTCFLHLLLVRVFGKARVPELSEKTSSSAGFWGNLSLKRQLELHRSWASVGTASRRRPCERSGTCAPGETKAKIRASRVTRVGRAEDWHRVSPKRTLHCGWHGLRFWFVWFCSFLVGAAKRNVFFLLGFCSPTAESFGVSAQIGSGVVRGSPEVRFHEGSTRVPRGFHEGSTRFFEVCGVVRALKRAPHAVGDIT